MPPEAKMMLGAEDTIKRHSRGKSTVYYRLAILFYVEAYRQRVRLEGRL
jgi:hypothetical protein